MKSVTYKRHAAKALRKHANMAARIRAAMEGYAADQTTHANNVSPLVGTDAKRMRVGDFRLVFDETATEIFVTKIAPRGSAYD